MFRFMSERKIDTTQQSPCITVPIYLLLYEIQMLMVIKFRYIYVECRMFKLNWRISAYTSVALKHNISLPPQFVKLWSLGWAAKTKTLCWKRSTWFGWLEYKTVNLCTWNGMALHVCVFLGYLTFMQDVLHWTTYCVIISFKGSW